VQHGIAQVKRRRRRRRRKRRRKKSVIISVVVILGGSTRCENEIPAMECYLRASSEVPSKYQERPHSTFCAL